MKSPSGSGANARTVAVTLARLALEQDTLAWQVELLEGEDVAAEWMFTSAWSHCRIAAESLDEVLTRKIEEAERSRRHGADVLRLHQRLAGGYHGDDLVQLSVRAVA